jgi:hypothetical protein
MKLVKTLDQYEGRYVIFCDSVKNNVVNEGTYIRLVYSTPIFSTNGLHMCFTVTPIAVDKCYSKYKITFDRQLHKEMIDKLKIIEEDIIKQVGIEDKVPHYKITEQIKYGHLKLSVDDDVMPSLNNEMTIILKISGVWETDVNYGVTYKFTNC